MQRFEARWTALRAIRRRCLPKGMPFYIIDVERDQGGWDRIVLAGRTIRRMDRAMREVAARAGLPILDEGWATGEPGRAAQATVPPAASSTLRKGASQ